MNTTTIFILLSILVLIGIYYAKHGKENSGQILKKMAIFIYDFLIVNLAKWIFRQIVAFAKFMFVPATMTESEQQEYILQYGTIVKPLIWTRRYIFQIVSGVSFWGFLFSTHLLVFDYLGIENNLFFQVGFAIITLAFPTAIEYVVNVIGPVVADSVVKFVFRNKKDFGLVFTLTLVLVTAGSITGIGSFLFSPEMSEKIVDVVEGDEKNSDKLSSTISTVAATLSATTKGNAKNMDSAYEEKKAAIIANFEAKKKPKQLVVDNFKKNWGDKLKDPKDKWHRSELARLESRVARIEESKQKELIALADDYNEKTKRAEESAQPQISSLTTALTAVTDLTRSEADNKKQKVEKWSGFFGYVFIGATLLSFLLLIAVSIIKVNSGPFFEVAYPELCTKTELIKDRIREHLEAQQAQPDPQHTTGSGFKVLGNANPPAAVMSNTHNTNTNQAPSGHNTSQRKIGFHQNTKTPTSSPATKVSNNPNSSPKNRDVTALFNELAEFKRRNADVKEANSRIIIHYNTEFKRLLTTQRKDARGIVKSDGNEYLFHYIGPKSTKNYSINDLKNRVGHHIKLLKTLNDKVNQSESYFSDARVVDGIENNWWWIAFFSTALDMTFTGKGDLFFHKQKS